MHSKTSLCYLLMLSAVPAFAQEPLEGNAGLEEVMVTARRVEESLQKVPLSISAFDAKAIEAAGMGSIVDVANETPGFSFRQAFGRDFDRPVIRGMSNIRGTNTPGNSNASFFIDGVFVNSSMSAFGLDDIERVEIIRGPQSALFGRSTFSGAINYVTKKPTDEFKGLIKATGAQYGRHEGSINLSGPIVREFLRFAMHARYYATDGMYRNQADDKFDIGGENSRSIGATLDWIPSGWFDATLRFNFAQDRDQSFVLYRQGSDLNNCYLPQAGLRRRGYYCGEVPRDYRPGANVEYFREAGYPAGIRRETRLASAVMRAHLADYTFTSTSSIENEDFYQAYDAEYSEIFTPATASSHIIGYRPNEIFTQELRVESPRNSRLRWLGGAYYYKQEPDDAWSGSLSGFNPANPSKVALRRTINNSKTESTALFGMVEFDVTEKLAVTAEARYGEDKITSGATSVVTRGVSATGWIPGSYSNRCAVSAVVGGDLLVCSNTYSDNASFNSFLPRFTATWSPTDAISVYGQFAKGNKPGGFNTGLHSAAYTPMEEARLETAGFSSYEEEEAESYEIGLKTTSFGNRLRVNMAAYFIDWTNQQLTQSTSALNEGQQVGQPPVYSLAPNTVNLGTTQIKGLELEATAILTDLWQLKLTYGLQDAEIKRYDSADQSDLLYAGSYTNCDVNSQCFAEWSALGSVAGNTPPLVPKNAGSIAATLRYPVGNIGALVWRTSYSYESSRYSQIHNLAETGDSHDVGVRVGLESRNWSATLWVTNLLDDDAPVGILRVQDPTVLITVPAQPPLPGTQRIQPRDFILTPPNKRQVGLTISYNF